MICFFVSIFVADFMTEIIFLIHIITSSLVPLTGDITSCCESKKQRAWCQSGEPWPARSPAVCSPTRGPKNAASTRKQESPCQQEAARRRRSFLWNVLKHKKNFLSGVLFCSASEAPRGLRRRRWRRWSLYKSLMTPEGETGVEASGLPEN